MSSDGRVFRWAALRSLRFRVAALLALSLLPIGLVTIQQTRELAKEVANRTELTLLSLTASATSGERQVVERGFGAAEAMTVVLQLLRDDPAACRAYLQDFLATTDRFTFVGFIPPSGVMTCSSSDETMDFSDDPDLVGMMGDPRARLNAIDTPAVSAEPVLSIMLPVFAEEVFIGYVSLSIPRRVMLDTPDFAVGQRPLSLTVFNAEGEILATELRGGLTEPALPAGVDLASYSGLDRDLLPAEGRSDSIQSFAIVPILPDVAYAIAGWQDDVGGPELGGIAIPPFVLPLLMFWASIAVAYLAVDRLVVRHVEDLQDRMRLFARRRELPRLRDRKALSTELRDLEDGFVEMAIDLANDEAKLEDSLREKNILLKEIHHRVKNNLQLISSIMNMQIRAASQPETEHVLRRLQERVHGLAAVHRNLYQTNNLSRTDAGGLLCDLVDQLVIAGGSPDRPITFEPAIEEVILFPDQALPLSLMASELITNAIKNADAPEGAPRRLRVELALVAPNRVRFSCENSVSETPPNNPQGERLGARLIQAFALQLGAEMEVERSSAFYRVTAHFTVESFSEVHEDY